jgi:predicted amidohydrolase
MKVAVVQHDIVWEDKEANFDRLGSLPKDAAYMDKPWRALDVLVAAEEVLASRRAAA